MRSAVLVASGIFLSRIAGFIRLRAFAHYFGVQSDAADAFNAAFRIPNFLQNLFGEGALSASFIPVYAALISNGDRKEADRVAGAIAALLALVVASCVLIGVLATPLLIDVIAPGFSGEKRTLTIQIVRVLFPGAGLLALSAWCLGVLNSHRRFLLSYTAPVIWNAAMVATLILYGSAPQSTLAVMLAWGSVVGSLLQFGIQLPTVLRVAPNLKLRLDASSEHVRDVVRNFGPALMSRGVVQISAFVDTVLASLLPTGALTGIANAQLLYTLPVSLFGMSVSAAELPAMSSASGDVEARHNAVRTRLNSGLRQIAFFVAPSAMAFLTLGDVISAALLQTGRFRPEDAVYVWAILAGSAVGLLPATLGRLYASSYFALRDTKTPLRFAIVRVILATFLGYFLSIHAVTWVGLEPVWGAAGITLAAGLAAWVEMFMLRRTLTGRIGRIGMDLGYLGRLWLAATLAAGVAWGVRFAAPVSNPILAGIVILAPYGVTFLVLVRALGLPEASLVFDRLRRR